MRKPVFLHVRTVRLLGHAGSDAEFVYRDMTDITATEFQDPLLHTARIILENNILTSDELINIYQQVEQRINELNSLKEQLKYLSNTCSNDGTIEQCGILQKLTSDVAKNV